MLKPLAEVGDSTRLGAIHHEKGFYGQVENRRVYIDQRNHESSTKSKERIKLRNEAVHAAKVEADLHLGDFMAGRLTDFERAQLPHDLKAKYGVSVEFAKQNVKASSKLARLFNAHGNMYRLFFETRHTQDVGNDEEFRRLFVRAIGIWNGALNQYGGNRDMAGKFFDASREIVEDLDRVEEIAEATNKLRLDRASQLRQQYHPLIFF